MTDTQKKIGSRRYSSPYRNKNVDQSTATLNQLLLNMSLNYRKRSSEKKTPTKYTSHSRQVSKETKVEKDQLVKNNFQLQYVIGVGGFGRVWKVTYKQQIFAMKEMSKALVLLKQSVQSIMAELQFLTELRHPFIINAFAAFQDSHNLYLVLDYLSGGDLRYHLGKCRRFSEEQTKFFAACIIVGLEYLHNQNIIHRDIKPENLILDNQGYVRITDLGVATKKTGQTLETSGTPGYMAPEVIFRQDHSFAVDYFALGVICYEFMTGRRPYYGNRKEIREQILAKQAYVIGPIEGWSSEAIDFINQLLQRKPQNRLINPKQHKWFKHYPFEALVQKKIKPPYTPISKDNFDKAQILYEDEENNQIIQQNQHLIRDNQQHFEGYQLNQNNDKQEKTQLIIRSRKSSIGSKIFKLF